jgi:S1-C subfamily serine protease
MMKKRRIMMSNKELTKKTILLFLVFIIIFAICSTAFAQMSIEDTRKSVVRVVVFDKNSGRYLGSGSGFVIGSNPPYEFVATAYHVVEGNVDIYIWRSKDDLIKTTIYQPLSESDIALLRIDPQHLLYGFQTMEIASRDMVNVGDTVYAVGFPAAADDVLTDFTSAYPEDSTVTRGVISKFSTYQGAAFHQMDAAVSWGNSGGPLVNEFGQVIGVVSRGAVLEGIYGAVQVDYLTDILDSRGITYDKAGSRGQTGNKEDAVKSANEAISALPPVDLLSLNDKVQVETARSLVSTAKNQFGATDSDFINLNALSSAEERIRILEETPVKKTFMEVIQENLLIILIAAAVLLIIAAILITKAKKPSAAVVAQSFSPHPGQQMTAAAGPVTMTKPERAPAVTQAKRMQPRPVIKGVTGSFAGQNIELVDNQLTIGRDPRLAQLVYPQNKEEISRKHCTIRFDVNTQKFTLTDYSSNGTYLSSNQKLDPGQTYYLNSGDRFYLAEPSEVFELKIEA